MTLVPKGLPQLVPLADLAMRFSRGREEQISAQPPEDSADRYLGCVISLQPALPAPADGNWLSPTSYLRLLGQPAFSDELSTMMSLEEAIRILNLVAAAHATGSTAVWRKVVHARRYLELQLEERLRETVS
jgi:hypothetical protein